MRAISFPFPIYLLIVVKSRTRKPWFPAGLLPWIWLERLDLAQHSKAAPGRIFCRRVNLIIGLGCKGAVNSLGCRWKKRKRRTAISGGRAKRDGEMRVAKAMPAPPLCGVVFEGWRDGHHACCK
jgi:hypothetical protein